MDLHEFEELWQKRHSLSPELMTELEKNKAESSHCRAFAETGNEIRQFLQEIPEVQASDNFAYRMRIYAQNHKNESVSFFEHPSARWTSVSIGIATGALLLMINTVPLNQNAGLPALINPTGIANELTDSTSIREVEEIKLATTVAESSHAHNEDSLSIEDTREPGNKGLLNIRTVSTSP
ncbi:MAG: hypothetical protein P9L92_04250 [Candidatus Electryonea clarkiae]|nr:hypothetical protein [Candidatus Electryonea clarkiae]MDP8286073.1 hypothetical protein [Candidatus Electryonea clarkiae]